jgi:putative SOS response-associated peptidase YedK
MDLMRPFPAEQMTAWEVDRKVCNVRNDMQDRTEPMGYASGSDETPRRRRHK